MIETNKMLYLRRYALTILRADAKSRVARTLHTATSSSRGKGGYNFRYVPSPARAAYVSAELSRSNNVACMHRLFCTTIVQSPVDGIDRKLMSLCEDAKHGQISADQLREVIRLCDENDYQLDDSTGVQLLKYCGDLLPTTETSERRDLADQVWQLVRKNGDATLTLDHYNMLLHVHATNGSSVNPEKFLASMSVEPNENTYRLLLNTAIKANDDEHLQEVMSMIKKRNISLDEDTLGMLTRTYPTNSNVSKTENVIKLAQDQKLHTGKMYTEMACEFATLGNIPSLVKIMNDEPQSDINILKIIKSLSISGNGRHIPVVLNFLTASVSAIESDIVKIIIELVHAKRTADAHIIVNCLALNKTTIYGMKVFVNSFLNELIMINAPVEDIVKYVDDYMDLSYDPQILTNIVGIGLKLGRENLCLAIFDVMQKKNIEVRPHYYWPLLTMAHKSKGETKVFSLVKNMVDIGVEIDYETLVSYVYPYVNTADPIITLQRLQTMGIPTIILQTPMISYLLFRNRMQDIATMGEYSYTKLHYRSLLKPLVQAYLAKRDAESCAKLLSQFKAGHEFVVAYFLMLLKHYDFYIEDLQLLLKAFQKYNVRIQRNDAQILKNKLKLNFSINENMNLLKVIDSLVDYKLENSTITLVPFWKYMSNKELICSFVEMESKRRSTRNVLYQLLENYCIEKNLKKAEEIKQKLEEAQFPISFSNKMYLFKLYLEYDKLKEAEALLDDLKLSNSLMIDSDKVIIFANALVNANRLNSAFDVINKITHVNNKRPLNRICYTLLNTLAHSEYHAYTKDMFNLLVQKEYCTITTEILRPLVAASLEHNNIPSAMNMFMQCVRKYERAPLAQEMLTALLREKDNSTSLDVNKNIEKVYNAVTEINGPEVANTLLAIALATLNKTEELQTVIKEQRISIKSLMYYFIYEQKQNVTHTDILLTILEAMDTTNIYQNILCDMLLSCYSKKSDCDNAVMLWEKMRAKDIEPSERFKNNFTQLLLMNKVPLPSEFKSYNNKVENSN